MIFRPATPPAPFSLQDAVRLVKVGAKGYFDETIEIAMRLNLDVRKQDQMLRAIAILPHGTGKKDVVAVFARGNLAQAATEAGADIVGAEDLAEKVKNGEINFTRCIATPDMMAIVGRLGKILGPKGLMPNPKLGTVTTDVTGAVSNAKKGQIQYRADRSGNVHGPVGKLSWPDSQVIENIIAFVESVKANKPSGAKGDYFKSVHLSSTQGRGVRISLNQSPFSARVTK